MPREKLQLVGIGAMFIGMFNLLMRCYLSLVLVNGYNTTALSRLMFICSLATKFEEISPPYIDEFIFIADNTYSKNEVNIKYW